MRDFNQDVPGLWSIVSCSVCGLGCLVPIPDSSAVASFYDGSFYSRDGKRFSSAVEGLRAILGRRRVALIRKYLPKPGRLLDFGAGVGHFGAAMAKEGWTVHNEDISYNQGSRLRLEEDKPVLDYPDGHFDVVSLWYVIEHMLNPRATLREVRRVLRDDGVLILSQQDFSSLQARFFGPCWLILDPPRHIYQFSPSNLSDLGAQEGFERIGLSSRCLEIGPFTILQGMLNRLLGNGNYLFKLLKNRGLDRAVSPGAARKEKALGLVSLPLSVGLAPVALVAYYLLVLIGSGDIFTLVLRKEPGTPAGLDEHESGR